MVDVFLSVAQVGFLIGQSFFIASNLQNVMHKAFGIEIDIRLYCKELVTKSYVDLLSFLVTTPLSYVRKIEKFAFSYVIADMLIFITTIVILSFATYNVTQEGWGNGVEAFNTSTWLTMIGSAVYAYEGFGTILPLLDVAEKPELFERTLFMVLATVFVLYTSFGTYCYFVYGDQLVDPLITANLQPQGLLVYIIKVAFSINLVLTFPLTVYPANIIIESYLFGDM
jgi:proton-coupled amino acid transporter